MSWLAYLRSSGLREASVNTMRRHLIGLSTSYCDVDPHKLKVEDLLAWAAEKQWAPETRHHHYVTWRSFFNWLNPGQPMNLPRVRRPAATPRPAPQLAVEVLLNASDPRVALACRFALLAGLRRSEIIQIHTDDFVDDLMGTSLHVRGKGGVSRLIPLSDDLLNAVSDYRIKLNITQGWLFPNSATGEHLSAHWLAVLVRRASAGKWTLHTFRHRFATNVYSATNNIVAVQQLLGHQDLATTQRYVAIASDELRNAVNKASHIGRTA